MGDKPYTIKEWQNWDNVACRTPIKEEIEKRAKKENRSLTNCLETILCDKLGIEIPAHVGKRK